MSFLFSVLLSVAALVCVVGLARKIYQYARTPAPLKIPTTPAPVTRTGVVFRLFREVVFFESLFKSSKWTWLFGWLFHAGLFLALAVHLRFFTDPVWWWVELIAPFGKYGGIAMFVGLIGLLGRRLLVERIKYISAPSDYLMLVLLMLIAVSGLVMRFVWHIDIVSLKQFAYGLVTLQWSTMPSSFVLFVHLLMVAILLLIFPFSKLLHVPGVFFSPSRNQVDNPREKRHLASWAKPLDATRLERDRG